MREKSSVLAGELAAAATSLAARPVPATRILLGGGGDRCAADERAVAVEAPVSIVYGTVPYAVMMASPTDLEDFAIGFSLTEGIVDAASEIRCISVQTQDEGLVVAVELAPGRFRAHLARRRNLSGRTSCGLCGVEDMAELPLATRAIATQPPVRASAIHAALSALERHQPLNALTRAVHAAAWCEADGRVAATREDVGRHNALDKLIGARLRGDYAPDNGFIVVTSRASFEMVEKAAIFGAATLVAISAPTSLAIERARALGLTLVAIARSDAVTLFTGRIIDDEGRSQAPSLVVSA